MRVERDTGDQRRRVAVGDVADHRVPGRRELDANLVAAASLQADLHQRGVAQVRHYAIVRDCDLPDFFVFGREAVQVLVGGQQAFERPLLRR